MDRRYVPIKIGADAPPPPPSPEDPLTLGNIGTAFSKISLGVIIVGIATGAAFAIGAGLADRYVLGKGRR